MVNVNFTRMREKRRTKEIKVTNDKPSCCCCRRLLHEKEDLVKIPMFRWREIFGRLPHTSLIGASHTRMHSRCMHQPPFILNKILCLLKYQTIQLNLIITKKKSDEKVLGSKFLKYYYEE
jgi:hypothetical protein